MDPVMLGIRNIRPSIYMSWLFKGLSGKKKQQPSSKPNKGKDNNNDSSDEEAPKDLDPDQIVVGESKDEPISDFSKDYDGFLSPSPQQLENMWRGYKHFPNDPNDDEPRHQLAYKKGGKLCGDQEQVDKIRSIGKEMIKKVGKQFISGELNLTKVSFPIKLMVPKSVLESTTIGCSMFPIFINKAAETEDPVERVKLFVTAVISSFYYMNMFSKPLNPILGETLEATYPDGTRVYCEQISHHPPTSYFLLVGPENKYRYYGYYLIEAKAGFNSLTLVNKGRRTLEFQNGQKIEVNFPKEVFESGFFGNLRSVTEGEIKFTDSKNKIEAIVNFGHVKKRPVDYFEGKISKEGKAVCPITGSYLGYINIGDERYFDSRYMNAIKINIEKSQLDSDHTKRSDLILLAQKKMKEAQTEKERMEDIQRADRKLRETKLKKK